MNTAEKLFSGVPESNGPDGVANLGATLKMMPSRAAREAERLLTAGFWPIPLYAPGVERNGGTTNGKEPFGKAWGVARHTPRSLKTAYADKRVGGVGIALGPGRAAGGGWLIDIEGDGPGAEESRLKLFGGEIVETMGWSSTRGRHALHEIDGRFLDLMQQAGAVEGKGKGAGVFKLAELPGLEFRIGGPKPEGEIKQIQSACPPTPGTDGLPRAWNGAASVAPLPDAAYRFVGRLAESKAERAAVQDVEREAAEARRPAFTTTAPGPLDKLARARLCVMSDKHPNAVEGSNGHGVLFSAACALVDGFGLSYDEAYPILCEFNEAKAIPPESDFQVRHKLGDAIEKNPSPSLRLLNAERWRNGDGSNGKPSEPAVESVEDLDDIEIVDRWPKADPAMFHGVAGEFVRRIAPETEADPVATLFQLLAGFGNLVGRGPHFVVGSTRHFTVLNVAVVGATAVGRKGSSGDDAEFLLGEVDPDWLAKRCRSGLATGEGLIHHVRDPKYRPPTKEEIAKKGYSPDDVVCEDEGVKDKRLHVVEPEMGAVLKVMGKNGNTLSEVIRRTFDGKNLGNLSKNAGCVATNPHITIVGHITKADITKCLEETDVSNGFANRFLWVAARRSKHLPDGGDMFGLDLSDLRERARRAKDFAKSLEFHRMAFDSEFRRTWRDIYAELSSDERHVVASRSEAYVKRLACAYALLDETAVVRVEHLEAASAAWDYVKQTIDYVFGSSRRDPDEVKLIDALKAAPDGLTRKQINVDVFGKHLKAKAIANVLGSLLTAGMAHSKSESAGRGRPAERWFFGRAN